MSQASSGIISFVSIDLESGEQTTLRTLPRSQNQAQALSTIDNKNGIYYILGYDGGPNLLGLDVANGAVVSNSKISAFQSQGVVGVGQGLAWVDGTSSIVAAGQDNTSSWRIGFVAPDTGDLEEKALLNNSRGVYEGLLGSPSIYSADRNSFIMAIGVRKASGSIFITADLDTGVITEQQDCGYTQTLGYDTGSKSIFGLGLITDSQAPGGGVRTLVQMKSDLNSCTVVGNVSGYLHIRIGVSALDNENKIVYFIANPCLHESDPGCLAVGLYDLVGVDMRTAKTVSSVAQFCSTETCPWSLEFANSMSL